MAVYEHTEEETIPLLKHTESHLYGSSRLGMHIPIDTPDLIGADDLEAEGTFVLERGNDRYELSNHLGNVLATVSDRILPIEDNGTVDYRLADVLTISDYYPFGAPMEGRSVAGDYRFGFQGQERDDEVSGEGNSYTAEFWQYDSRIGRRWNVDPVVKEFESPYAAFANSPLRVIDPDGADTLFIHRNVLRIIDYETKDGEKGQFILYNLNFIFVQDKVEMLLPLSLKQVALKSVDGYGSLIKPKEGVNYNLVFEQMNSHPDWLYTIHVEGLLKKDGGEAAVYAHPVGWPVEFGTYAGCMGICEDFHADGSPSIPNSPNADGYKKMAEKLEHTQEILKNIFNVYSNLGIGDADGNCDGNSFILTSTHNLSRKPMKKMDSLVPTNLK